MSEGRREVGDIAAREAGESERRDEGQERESQRVLEDRTQPDAPVVEERDERREQEADQQAGGVDRAARHRVERVRAENREDPGEEIAARDRLPGADDRVGQHHRPSRREAEEGRKDILGIGHLRARVGNPADEPSVGQRDRREQQAADQETEDGACGTASAEPVAHEDDPPHADHRAEAKGEVLDGGEGSLEAFGGHGRCRSVTPGRRRSHQGNGQEREGVSGAATQRPLLKKKASTCYEARGEPVRRT
jgi:hypothetical protein